MAAPLTRRRALAALTGLGIVGVVGTGRASAQEGSGPGMGQFQTAQDAAGPVVVATGTGSASVPADRALIQVIVRSTDYYGGKSDGPVVDPASGTPIAGPSPEVMQAAVDVLIEAGLSKDDIVVVASSGSTTSSYFGLGSGMIGAQLTGEQLGLLPELLQDAASALAEEGLMVDPPMAVYLSDGCADLRGQALDAAVAAARQDAAALAGALGVEVTTLHRATELGYSYGPYAYVSGPSDACDALPGLADLPRTYLAPYDASALPEFTVTASVELTMNVVEPEG